MRPLGTSKRAKRAQIAVPSSQRRTPPQRDSEEDEASGAGAQRPEFGRQRELHNRSRSVYRFETGATVLSGAL